MAVRDAVRRSQKDRTMDPTYGSNRPPLARPDALVTAIAFSTSLAGAVLAGVLHPAAGLAVLAVGLMGALSIHHVLWRAEEEEIAAFAPGPPLEIESTVVNGARIYPARRA
jgi:hypothetical protein